MVSAADLVSSAIGGALIRLSLLRLARPLI
jgi:hypothetical protein